MSYINKDATLAAIANKAKEELADVNHYFLEGVQLAVDVVEGMPEVQPSSSCVHENDTISRKAAIDAIVNTVSEIGLHDNSEVARYGATFMQHEIIDIIEGMPSAQPKSYREGYQAGFKDAQPERKKGKWIYGEDEYGVDGYHCDECGFFVPWDYAHTFINYIEDYKYCPNCGADMRGEADED